MDFMEIGIFGFLMKNWIDSAKKIRGSPKFAVRGQTNISDLELPPFGRQIGGTSNLYTKGDVHFRKL